MTEQHVSTWQYIQDELRKTLGEATFKSWLGKLELVNVADQRVSLAAPTRFIRERVLSHYIDPLIYQWQKHDNNIDGVDIYVRQPHAAATSLSSHNESTNTSEVLDFTVKHVEDNLSSPLDSRFTFDNFITGKSNELAFAAAKSIATAGSCIPGTNSNPLFLYGGVGLGKTHLMHAIAWEFHQNHPHKNVVYMSAEKFMFQFIRSIRNKDMVAFKEQFRLIDVMLVDDIQFISGKESTVEEFFHAFNTLVDNQRQVIISGDRSPTDLEGMGERARSRLGWGLVVDIEDCDFDLRVKILKHKCEEMQTEVPEDVLRFLAHTINNSVREMEGALNKLIVHSNLLGSSISMENTKRILKDTLRSHTKNITIPEIQKKVAAYFDIKISDLQSNRRMRHVARPRQIAMYLAKKLTPKSLMDIGRAFGGKDHTTVMHAIKRVESLIESDPEIADAISDLQA